MVAVSAVSLAAINPRHAAGPKRGCYAPAILCEIPRLIGSPNTDARTEISSSGRMIPRRGARQEGNEPVLQPLQQANRRGFREKTAPPIGQGAERGLFLWGTHAPIGQQRQEVDDVHDPVAVSVARTDGDGAEGAHVNLPG